MTRPAWRAPLPSSGVPLCWACCLASRVCCRDHMQGCLRPMPQEYQTLARAAATAACRRCVQRGCMLADDGLRHTQAAVPRSAAGAASAANSHTSSMGRPAGSCLSMSTCSEPRHVGGGLATAQHTARTAGQVRRQQQWWTPWCAHKMCEQTLGEALWHHLTSEKSTFQTP